MGVIFPDRTVARTEIKIVGNKRIVTEYHADGRKLSTATTTYSPAEAPSKPPKPDREHVTTRINLPKINFSGPNFGSLFQRKREARDANRPLSGEALEQFLREQANSSSGSSSDPSSRTFDLSEALNEWYRTQNKPK